MILKILLLYLLVVNTLLFVLMGLDKGFAKKNKRRVPERTLFLLCLVGGSIGGLAGMYAFRHKTKHWSFRLGFPLILLVQIALAVFVNMKM